MSKTLDSRIEQTALQKHAGSLAMGLKASVVVVCVVAFYFQDLSIVFMDALRNEAASYVLAVPPLLAYLVYRKRKMLRVTVSQEATYRASRSSHVSLFGGVLLCALSVLVYWYGSSTFVPLEYHLLTLPVFTAGLILVLFNPRALRQAAFPVAFLVFLAPPSSETLQSMGAFLSMLSSRGSEALANILGVGSRVLSVGGTPVITVIRPDKTPVTFAVDVSCSGMYVLISFVVFAVFIAYVTRDKAWKKATLFLIGFPVMMLLNIVRIALILLIAYHYGEQLALQVFHFFSGWVLLLLGTIVLLLVTEKAFRISFFGASNRVPPCQKCESATTSQPRDFCLSCGRLLKYPQTKLRKLDAAKIVAVMLSVALLLSIQAPAYVLSQGPAQILVQTANGEQGNTAILPQIPNRTLQFTMRSTSFEQISGQDLSLVYSYVSPDRTSETVWVGLEIAQTPGPLHRWEVCVISWPAAHGGQTDATQLDLRDVQLLQNPPLTARYFAFNYKQYNETEIVLYWFETSVFTINNTSRQEQVKISVATYHYGPVNLTEEEDQLLPFAKTIAENWEPLKTWAEVDLFILQNTGQLIAFTATLLTATFVYELVERKRTRAGRMMAYKKLSSANQQIVGIVKRTEETTMPTMQNILEAYKNTTSLTMQAEEMLQELVNLEETGLISSRTSNHQDNPVQTWKANTASEKNTSHPDHSMLQSARELLRRLNRTLI